MSHFYDHELDFIGARADLDSVLESIIARTNTNSDSTTKGGDADILESPTPVFIEKSDFDFANNGSPKKVILKSTRKRKRKEDVKEERHRTNSCVMKLFDRSVDLAQFSETSPLFPICRAWMMNDPYSLKSCRTICGSDNSKEGSACSIVVPKPDEPFINFLDETQLYLSPRIPTPLPQPDMDLESYLKHEKPVPRAETLLLENLSHWKSVRHNWLAKSFENERRYLTGMNILSNMALNHTYSS